MNENTIKRFTELLNTINPTLEPSLVSLISSRFERSLWFVTEKPGMEDKRFEFYKQTGVFERNVYYDYGLKCIPNKATSLKALIDLSFEIKTESKLNNKYAYLAV